MAALKRRHNHASANTDAPVDHGRQRRRLRRHAWQSSFWLLLWLLMLNLLAWRFAPHWTPQRWRQGDAAALREIALALDQPLHIDCVMYGDHPLYSQLRFKLTQFREVARQAGTHPIELRYIDPRRDVRLMDALEADLAGASEAILLRYGSARRRLLPDDLIERRLSLDAGGLRHTTTGYLGDAVLSATLRELLSGASRKIYVLEGQGQRRFDDYHERHGYSDMARLLRHQGYQWESLNLARQGNVPTDAAAVLTIGPRGALTRDEADALREYLGSGGRLLALLDAGVRTGLERLLADWHLYPLPALASGKTFTGDELVVVDYGHHPITRSLRNTLTLFARPGVLALHAPESSERTVNGGGQDRPRATVLAGIDASGWYRFLPEAGASDPSVQLPRRGPAALAVALERGGASDLRVPPARIVVVADARLAENGMLALGAAGNRDLFLNALAWLTDASVPLATPEATPTLQVVLSERGWAALWYGTLLGLPGALALLGLVVLRARGRSAR